MPDAAFSFIRGFRLADAPVEVVDQAKSCLLDLIGVAAAGSQLASSRIIRSVVQSQFGGADGFFLFDGRSVSPAGAALANPTTIDSFSPACTSLTCASRINAPPIPVPWNEGSTASGASATAGNRLLP